MVDSKTRLLEDDDSETELMETKPKVYDLTKELYPLPNLVRYYEDRGFKYDDIVKKFPEYFPYDAKFANWWRNIRQIVRTRKLTPQPIYRQVTSIWRYRIGNKEKITYSEVYTAVNTKTGLDENFHHIAGVYKRHIVNDEYDYESDTFKPKLKGVETIYNINYDPKLLDELLEYAPPNQAQKLYVVALKRTHGISGLVTNEQFRNGTIEDLIKIGISGKGLIHTGSKMTEDETKMLELMSANPEAFKSALKKLQQELKDKASDKKQ